MTAVTWWRRLLEWISDYGPTEQEQALLGPPAIVLALVFLQKPLYWSILWGCYLAGKCPTPPPSLL